MRILLVEDSRVFARMVQRVLSGRLELTVDTAASLAETKELLAQNSYDAAVVDLVLPDAPSGQAVDVVIEHGIPTVACTGVFDESHREKLLERKAVDYVIKSSSESVFQVAEIIERLHRNAAIRILVVDDSASIRRLLCDYLQAYRFRTIDTKDAKTALELLEEHSDIHLVLSDYNMAGMDGYQLLEQIRRNKSRTELPFIGISGAGSPFLSARFIKLGANDFISKPVSREELYCRVINSIEMLEHIEELRELNSTKNRFLGMAAHDLRNPINGISGFSELLLETEAHELDDQAKQFLQLIHQSSEEMLTIVNDLLDINAIESGKLDIQRQREDLNAIVQGRLQLFDMMARQKNIRLSFFSEVDHDVLLDRSRIYQVLDNFISNAIKFSFQEGSVEVKLIRAADTIQVEIHDSGPGLSEDDQQKLFKPFSRAAARPTAGEKSSGLGLAITKRIVEAHGGEVGAKNRTDVERGAVFWFSLPEK
jgi:two-component system sensor histidine kinase/response regulator